MEKFREILRLHELGYSQCAIAQSCAVARSTVQDYIRRASAKGLSYEQLNKLSDSEAQEQLGKGKRKVTQSAEPIDFARVDLELQRKGVTLALLWQEGLDKQQWQCSYGTFCRRYNQWRGQKQLSMRQVYRGGEKLFVDYCGLTIPVVHPKTGEVNSAQIFVACLGASNYTYAEATPSQELSHWIGAHQRALAFLGGVPECIVPDNLKSGVTDPCRYEPGVNRSYQEFAEHYSLAIIPARPSKPRDKAKVEKAVQEVERQILAPVRHEQFTSFTDLNATIAIRLKRLNERVMHGYGLSRQALFEQVDKPALKPLPTQQFVFARWKTAKVNLDYHIEVERHYYSVPYWFVQREVRVKVSEQLIEVFHDGKRLACHERSRVSYRHTTLPDHMPPEHWAYKRQSKERFLAWAQQIGPHTQAQVQAIFDRKDHEEQAFRSIRGLQRLGQQSGSDRLEAACQRANVFGMVGLRRVRSILDTHLDCEPVPTQPDPAPVVEHANVRGPLYYH
ncbi:MAG: IS21 family transposase ISPpu7 [Chroococcidiopsis cubana SAG 39.79]|uniref:Integrase n=2 Tax=Chroococcidiopsis TaxID=54298 RepID=A0AB37UBA1_9CYAN|nr:IS21 family transposase [Chroococcidiopsis cubana]MDZ4877971.1 IS21 family transposase ISPpu7 [Chroococcidiopsis cubana SAG 39.79]RUT04199.1 integrase [Chroococcidiopsis cubana SAG 39.79]